MRQFHIGHVSCKSVGNTANVRVEHFDPWSESKENWSDLHRSADALRLLDERIGATPNAGGAGKTGLESASRGPSSGDRKAQWVRNIVPDIGNGADPM